MTPRYALPSVDIARTPFIPIESETLMVTRRFTVAVLGIALTVGGLTACTAPSQSAESKDSSAPLAKLLPARYVGGLNVASGVYAPMEYLAADGKFTGFDYDLGQALARELGTTFTFQTQDFTTIIPSLQSGKHDIIMFGMNDTAEREKTLDFVDYFDAGLAIVVAKGNAEGIKGLTDLCGKTVAVAKGTTQATFVEGQASTCKSIGSQPIKALELPSEGDALLAVRSKQAVADVFDAAPAAYSAATAGDGQQFEVVVDPKNPKGFGAVPTGIGVLKKNHDLTTGLKAALAAVIKDGTYKKLLEKYSLTPYGVESAVLNGSK